MDAVVVGAGMAGLYMLHRLRQLGFSTQVLEAGGNLGGVWYWNRYPGARCDIESMSYSYSFSDELQQEWEWTERFASQPEVLRYLDHVADRFDLRSDIEFNTRVTKAIFDDHTLRWLISTDTGMRLSATFCIMAVGVLSKPKLVEFSGLGTFSGDVLSTSAWPHSPVDFTGLNVAVVGTGSSGIQSIPLIAQSAEHVAVFQRTPNFSVPANNAPLDPRQVAQTKANYRELRRIARANPFGVPSDLPVESALEVTPKERQRAYETRWNSPAGDRFSAMQEAYTDLLTNLEANATIADFVRDKIRAIVRDPAVAQQLLPDDHPFGTKRLCVDTNYYDTYINDHVSLIDVRASPIREIIPAGVRTTCRDHSVDLIVFALGFDAMTGPLLTIDIQGRLGQPLRSKWNQGPRNYLGLQVAGFPNLFTITGPGSPSVLTNMVVAIEQHVEWIADCLHYVRDRGLSVIEPTVEAERTWGEHVNEEANSTLYPLANSWYVGANVPGKPRVFLPYVGGMDRYIEKCDQVVESGYRGFTLGP